MRARIATIFLGSLASGVPHVLGNDILATSGFTSCMPDSSQIAVQNLNIQFDRQTSQITFDVAGSSGQSQNITASLYVSAYGNQVYQKDFDPCDASTKVDQLCPVPAGNFAAKGVQDVCSRPSVRGSPSRRCVLTWHCYLGALKLRESHTIHRVFHS